MMLWGANSAAQAPLAVNSSDVATGGVSRAAAGAGWDSLKQTGLYHEAKVLLTDGKSHRGEVVSVSDEALVIHSGKGDQTLARTSIERVSIRRQSHRGRNALIGAGVGAGVGLGLGVAVDQCSPSAMICTGNKGKGVFTPLVGLIGAGVGALMPTGGWQVAYRMR